MQGLSRNLRQKTFRGWIHCFWRGFVAGCFGRGILELICVNSQEDQVVEVNVVRGI